MKKIVMLAAIAMAALSSFAQGLKPKTVDIERFFKSTTSVLLFGENRILDAAFKSDIDKYWKVTPVKYIGQDEFEATRTDAKNSFLSIVDVTYSNDKTEKPYMFLSLSVGGNAGSFADMPDLGFVPYCTSYDDANDNVYMIPVIVEFLQKHVQNLKRNPKVVEESLRYYNKNVSMLADKTILICKDDVAAGVSEERMKKKNKNDIQFVSREEIEKAVEERRPNTVVSFLVYPKDSDNSRCYKMLFGADDSMLYFYGYHRASALQKGGFTRWDIERIARY